MADIEVKVKCGRCKVPLESSADANGENIGRCPSCGVSDTFENILREVGKYTEEQLAQNFEKIFAGATKGNDMVKFTPAVRPKRSYRFITDLDLH